MRSGAPYTPFFHDAVTMADDGNVRLKHRAVITVQLHLTVMEEFLARIVIGTYIQLDFKK